MKTMQYHVLINHPQESAAKLLADESKLSVAKIKLAMTKGAVWLSNDKGVRRIRRAKTQLKSGNELHLYYDEAVLNTDIPVPQLIADETDYSVWFKPRGLLCQGSKWGDHCTIHRWIETHDAKKRPAIIVHRLDKAACGLILIAHSKKIANALSKQFSERQVEKKYKTLVSGQFSNDEQEIIFSSPVNGKSARSRVRQIQYDSSKNLSLLEVTIETGRKHQIRQHLSENGFPILGDRLYGGGDSVDLQLAAVLLSFACPLSQIEKRFELPEHLQPCID